MRPGRADLRLGRADFRLKRLGLRPERLSFRPERLDLRPERLGLRPERSNGEGGGRTNESPLVFYRTSSPFGAVAQKPASR